MKFIDKIKSKKLANETGIMLEKKFTQNSYNKQNSFSKTILDFDQHDWQIILAKCFEELNKLIAEEGKYETGFEEPLKNIPTRFKVVVDEPIPAWHWTGTLNSVQVYVPDGDWEFETDTKLTSGEIIYFDYKTGRGYFTIYPNGADWNNRLHNNNLCGNIINGYAMYKNPDCITSFNNTAQYYINNSKRKSCMLVDFPTESKKYSEIFAQELGISSANV